MNEKAGLIQEQKQEQKLAQSFSQQQLLYAQLVELPVTQLLERVNTEMDDNPALEINPENLDYIESADASEGLDTSDAPEDYDTLRDREDRQSALDEALASIGRDDEDLPVYNHSNTEEREDIIYGDYTSFYDQLKEQMGLANLTDTERDIMEYLIGSLDDDGLLPVRNTEPTYCGLCQGPTQSVHLLSADSRNTGYSFPCPAVSRQVPRKRSSGRA